MVSASPQSFCPEAAPTTSLIMQLKSFSWAEQIFTAYFAANCFAWRKVPPRGLTHLGTRTSTYPVTWGPRGADQVAVTGVRKANVSPGRHGAACGPMTSRVPPRQPQIPAMRVREISGLCPTSWGVGGGGRHREHPAGMLSSARRSWGWSSTRTRVWNLPKGPLPLLPVQARVGKLKAKLEKSRRTSLSLFYSLWTSSPSQAPFSPLEEVLW